MQDWYHTTFDMIDTRSFSNLWYWIVVVATWSLAIHYVLGVPYGMILRARRDGAEAEAELVDMVRVQVIRLLRAADSGGAWILGLACFALTTLALLGFLYGIELAQAVFLLALPICCVFALSVRTARRIRAADGQGMHEMLAWQRLLNQVIGMTAIFATAFWGMLQNLPSPM
ncbi:component of SufBCD complex [Tropicimonas sp. IMCC34043]|uniref:component of SufBCD complex n=1 Tax=Tropicimonas sp. IMCC34043 TaxID=2248760 RepID=UPI001E51AACB|nr:component of SufBCD complex [Tropicimonas sp. IMCC34043]